MNKLIEEHGTQHEKVKSKIEEMKKNPKVTVDPNFQKLIDEIEKTTNDNDSSK